LFKNLDKEELDIANDSKLYACKIVERKNLTKAKERYLVSEIENQDSVQSKYTVKIRKAIKTDSRYYIFMEHCNGSDLRDIMNLKDYDVPASIIHTIMQQLIKGFSDMMRVLVIHRDMKLQNVMVHFPDE
jgi:serine/threonine protein kinase